MDYTEHLPPLPEPVQHVPPHNRNFIGYVHAYTADQLRNYALAAIAAAAPAIRRAEKERIFAHADKRRAAESDAAAHHAGNWQPAFEAHTTRHAAMCDMLDAIRALPEEP